MPRARHARLDCSPGCAVEATLRFIDGKWKGVILWHLLTETLRFNQLRRLLPSVTQRMLTNQLRELEQDGFVARRIYAEIPPRVEYSLTERGRTLAPVLLALKAWGDAYGEVEEKAEAA
jgi:DNA-binding HxlR family transcriptional regulator